MSPKNAPQAAAKKAAVPADMPPAPRAAVSSPWVLSGAMCRDGSVICEMSDPSGDLTAVPDSLIFD